MANHGYLVVLALWLSLADSSLGDPPIDDETGLTKSSWTKRREVVWNALQNGKFRSLRAAEEVAFFEMHFENEMKHFFPHGLRLPKGIFLQLPQRYVDAIAGTGRESVADIIKVMNAPEISQEEYDFYLMCLGRMGSAAKEAVPFLRNAIKARPLARGINGRIRLVLASLGDNSKENVRLILRDLEDPTQRDSIVKTMIGIRGGSWVNAEIMRELYRRIRSTDDREKTLAATEELLDDAVALGMIGERSSYDSEKLQRLFERALKESFTQSLILALSLARVKPEKRGEVLRLCFKERHRLNNEIGRGTVDFLLEYCYLLVDSRTSLTLGKLVADGDPEVWEAAAEVLLFAGLSGRDAVPDLLRILQTSKEEKKREMTALVLGRISDFTLVPRLEIAIRNDKTVKNRRALQEVKNSIQELDGYEDKYLQWFLNQSNR